jgi:hypothetical protein
MAGIAVCEGIDLRQLRLAGQCPGIGAPGACPDAPSTGW